MQEHERQQLDQPYPEGPRVGSDAALGVGNNPISHSSHHGSDSLAVIEEVIHRAYLNKLVGEEGLRIVECIPEEEITDERLAELTGGSEIPIPVGSHTFGSSVQRTSIKPCSRRPKGCCESWKRG